MNFIAHRINTVSELCKLPHNYGVEIDIRSFGKHLILAHDPFVNGEPLEEFLGEYRHGTLILNVKCEAIEWEILELLKKYSIHDYFFLDSTFPMITKLIKAGEDQLAIRYSEYESIETAFKLAGKVNWIWVDVFTHMPMKKDLCQLIHEKDYQTCLVSPELVGRPSEIEAYAEIIKEQAIKFDAICTKSHEIDRWKHCLNL